MNEKKYQIFVSSTYDDLKEERDALFYSILEIRHLPVGMEMFNASDTSQWEVIKRTIDMSDYYVLVVAKRYGSVNDLGISYTELEFDYAVSQGIPIIVFELHRDAHWPADRFEVSKAEQLKKFGEKYKKDRQISFWRDKSDLAKEFLASFLKLMAQTPRPGWVREGGVSSSETATEILRLTKENSSLKAALSRQQQANSLNDELDEDLDELLAQLSKHTYELTVLLRTKDGTPARREIVHAGTLDFERLFLKMAEKLWQGCELGYLRYYLGMHFMGDWMTKIDSPRDYRPEVAGVDSWLQKLKAWDLVVPSVQSRPVAPVTYIKPRPEDPDTYIAWKLTEKGERLEKHLLRNMFENDQ